MKVNCWFIAGKKKKAREVARGQSIVMGLELLLRLEQWKLEGPQRQNLKLEGIFLGWTFEKWDGCQADTWANKVSPPVCLLFELKTEK